MFLGTSNKIFLSCVVCFDRCELVSKESSTKSSTNLMTLLNIVPSFLPLDQCSVHFQIETPTCSNRLTIYSTQLNTAFPPGKRRRRDVADDVIESRPRRTVERFTSDGMEVSIQIGSQETQENLSSTQGNIMIDLNKNTFHKYIMQLIIQLYVCMFTNICFYLHSDNLRSCYTNISVLLPLSLLTVLLLVSMLMTFYFCTKLTSGNGPQTISDDVAKKP